MKILKFCLSVSVMLLVVAFHAGAQSTDTLKTERMRRNIIKLNLSSLMVYKDAALVEFEHVVNKKQSFSIQAGFVSVALGSFLGSDSIRLVNFTRNGGFSVTADYRFYLLKESKDGAPHGVYIGPYIAYINMQNESNLTLGKNANTMTTKIEILSFGIELGYQFLLGKHWTLDFILIGPSLTNYKTSMHLALPVNTGDPNTVYQKVLEAMANRFPVVGSLINDQSADFKGNLDGWNAGFRYSMHVGYRF
ncbi:MAG TPA: DUF3575 domain-containing protein [Cyclobacteriaceae bacterium]|nr:DUF3575 domain-containing protein [Cyclobacteriaceae bacterium]